MTTLPRTLPKFADVRSQHTVDVGEQTVVFNLQVIPGATFEQLRDDHRSEDGTVDYDTAAVPTLVAGIDTVYSSVESTPVPFTEDDATEVWETWPDWARWSLLNAVITFSTKGPAADPFDGSTRNGNTAS